MVKATSSRLVSHKRSWVRIPHLTNIFWVVNFTHYFPTIRMNITLAGGYVAKMKGLTTTFGENHIKECLISVNKFFLLLFFSGDIDCFLDKLTFATIKTMMTRGQQLDGCDFKKIRLVSQRPYTVKDCFQVFNIVYDRTLTKIQVGGAKHVSYIFINVF